jgi:hypothetical protein
VILSFLILSFYNILKLYLMELGPTVIKSKEKKIEDEILKRWMKTLKKKKLNHK